MDSPNFFSVNVIKKLLASNLLFVLSDFRMFASQDQYSPLFVTTIVSLEKLVCCKKNQNPKCVNILCKDIYRLHHFDSPAFSWKIMKEAFEIVCYNDADKELFVRETSIFVLKSFGNMVINTNNLSRRLLK